MRLLNAETPLESLPITPRTYNCLKSMGLNTLGDVAAKRDVDLLRCPNFGRKSLREILEFVRALHRPCLIPREDLALVIANSGRTYQGDDARSTLAHHTQQTADLARYIADRVMEFLEEKTIPCPANPEQNETGKRTKNLGDGTKKVET